MHLNHNLDSLHLYHSQPSEFVRLYGSGWSSGRKIFRLVLTAPYKGRDR